MGPGLGSPASGFCQAQICAARLTWISIPDIQVSIFDPR
jgi:hypothetical protein